MPNKEQRYSCARYEQKYFEGVYIVGIIKEY